MRWTSKLSQIVTREKRIRLVWSIPTALLVLAFDFGMHHTIDLPAPFLIILASVVLAGTYGGRWAGLLAGTIASAFLLHAYVNGFGPAELTSGLPQVAVGVIVFLFIGYRLGLSKDRSEASQREFLATEDALNTSIRFEQHEKNKQTAMVADSEERLRMAVRISGIGHYKWDYATGDCIYCSGQHAAHFGISPEQFYELNKGNAPYTGNIHEDDRAAFVDAVARIDGGEAVLFEYRAVHPDGTVRFIRQITEPVFDETGQQIEVVGSSIDLTDLREAEARLRQAQRVEAIGTLTGGIAHDFNNILAIILGNLELSLESDDDAERRDFLRHAITATNKGADLTKNLLSFARRAHLEPSRLNLNKTVRNTVQWGTRVLPESISIENSLQLGLWDTELDATSLENAIVNILLNARDAMPDGGQITIKTTNTQIADVYPHERGEKISPGKYVMLAISDTGCGIDPAALDRIFEPFHTTKRVGEGSGLGLSMVQGFIKQSGGALRVHSKLGEGTTFKLYFKAATEPAPAQTEAAPPAQAHIKTGAKILVVEDEEGVSRIIRKTLQDAGYTVMSAENGDTGLEKFKRFKDFDLLLTDVVMPGKLQGPALAKAIRSLAPELPCVFMSGYAADVPTHGPVHGKGQFSSDIRLMKPISRAELLDAVSNALQPTTPELVDEDG